MALLAVDLDVAVRLLDEAVDHAEAEAGALADFLGGEERLDDLVEQMRRDAAAGIADGDQHVGSRRHLVVGSA